MRPPYVTCRRHCLHWERCRQVLEGFERDADSGDPHPLSLILADGCPMFGMPVLRGQAASVELASDLRKSG